MFQHHNDNFQQDKPTLKPTEVNLITFTNSVHPVAEEKYI